jgi:hypothetical protein
MSRKRRSSVSFTDLLVGFTGQTALGLCRKPLEGIKVRSSWQKSQRGERPNPVCLRYHKEQTRVVNEIISRPSRLLVRSEVSGQTELTLSSSPEPKVPAPSVNKAPK